MKQKTEIIYENTVAGTFVRRINRFTAEVLIDGETELVHVKNTGRLQELLLPEAKVTLQKKLNENRKTARRKTFVRTGKGGKGRLPLYNRLCDSDEWNSSGDSKRGETARV